MSIPQPLYINGPTLSAATAVYSDPLMTTCAPDGYYSDGTVVRQQFHCALLPEQACGNCGVICPVSYSKDGGKMGVYNININLGTDTGAIIVRFNPTVYPDGIMATYNSTVYNKLSAQTDGYHAAPSGSPTYIGNSDYDFGLVSGSPYYVNVYNYDGSSFLDTGSDELVTITSPQVSLTSSDYTGNCIMVIPKLSASPSLLSLSMYGFGDNVDFTLDVECPQKLPLFFSTSVFDGTEPCGLSTDQVYYSAPVNGDGITLGLYDWVFSDINGSNILPNGWYLATANCPFGYDSFQVTDGVIVAFDSLCSPTTLDYEVVNNSSACVSGGITSTNLKVDWQPLNVNIIDTNAHDGGSVSIQSGVYSVTMTVTYDPSIVGCTEIVMSILLNSIVVSSAIVTPVSSGVYEIYYTFIANSLTTYSILATVDNSY